MAAALWPRSTDRQTTDAVRVESAAQVFFYDSGTTTPQTVYQDNGLTTAHASPVVADAYGVWPAVYISPGSYRFRIYDSEGVLLDEADGVVAPGEPGEGELTASTFVETNLLPAEDAETFLNALGVTDAAITVLDDTTVAAMRATLDVPQIGIAPIVTDATTAKTLALTDVGDTVRMTSGSANVVTIPANSAVAFTVGTYINIKQIGAGTTSITADTGVTLNGASAGSCDISQQYGGVSLHKVGTDAWEIVGSHGTVS